MSAYDKCREMGGSINYEKQSDGGICPVCTLNGQRYSGPALNEQEIEQMGMDCTGFAAATAQGNTRKMENGRMRGENGSGHGVHQDRDHQ